MRRIRFSLFLFLAAAAVLLAIPARPATGVPTVALISPVGGETWMSGSTQVIKWNNGPYITDVTVAFCPDGANWELIADQMPALASQEQSVSWQFPDIVSDVCTIRIIFHTSYNGNTSVGSVDSGYFSLHKLSLPKKLGAPSNLTATAASDTSIQLNWTNVSGQAQLYIVERYIEASSTWEPLVSDLAADVQSFQDHNLAPATTYHYRVYCTAEGWNPSVYSNEASAATLAPPAIPIPSQASDLQAELLSSQEVKLSWSDNSNNEACFLVMRATGNNGGMDTIATVPADSAAYTDNTVEAGLTYHYRVAAVNNLGEGTASNIASISVPDAPDSNTSPTIMRFQVGSYTYYVNNLACQMDAPPIATEGRILMPIRFVVESLGGAATWDGSTATVTCNGHIIQMWLNSNTASVDGASMPIDSGNPAVAPVVSSNRLMLPLRFVSENIGCSAEWTGTEAIIACPAAVIGGMMPEECN